MTTAPLPNHGKVVNAIDDAIYATTVDELTFPLMSVKKELLQAGLFPGCARNCSRCTSQPHGCESLKEGIQKLMDDCVIV